MMGWYRRAGSGLLLVAVVLAGCGEPKRQATREPSVEPGTSPQPPAPRAMRNQLLAGMVSILSALDRYDESRGGEQAFDRLVQWRHAAGEPKDSAVAGPSLESLPAAALEAGRPIMERPRFDAPGDVVAIRDQCWLAAIARTVRGTASDDLEVAQSLFQWTVRSLAVVSDPPMIPSDTLPGTRWFLPGEILLAGRASPAQRAWIFLELLRQAGIDGVMVATGAADGPARPWVPAALIAGEAYLFEPAYGMPIPGPDGKGVATLRQARDEPAILASLSLPDRRYPVQAEALAAGVVPLVAADPWALSRRMTALDRELAPTQGIRVAVDTAGVTARATAIIAPADGTAASPAVIWAFPWETIARRGLAATAAAEELGPLQVPVPDPQRPGAGFRALFAGRVREFRGDYDGPGGAKAAYLAARVSRRELAGALAGVPEAQSAAITNRLIRMKEDATYWLGLVMLAEGQDEAAVDYLQRMTLEASPDSRWTDAARVNLASALARLGRPADAVSLLRADGSPQRYGSRILADRLESAPDRAP